MKFYVAFFVVPFLIYLITFIYWTSGPVHNMDDDESIH